jgi:hypothetical protein
MADFNDNEHADMQTAPIINNQEVKMLWEKIDRKMKRATPQDDEIAGSPNYLMIDPQDAPLILDNKMYNVLGGLSTQTLSDALDQQYKIKYERINRYRALENTSGESEGEGILNIYADEATTEDIEGNIIHVIHPDKRVVELVDEMFERVGIHEKAWEIIWNMCAFGDEFYEVIPNKIGTMILQLMWIPRAHMERIEQNAILVGFKEVKQKEEDKFYSFNVRRTAYDLKHQEEELVYPWRILHFRIPSTKYNPYGRSILDNVAQTIDHLNLMIKSMLIARITRAPERRIFNVDVGSLQGEKAIRYANEAVGYLRKKKIINMFGKSGERPDALKDIFGATEDIILPKRSGADNNSIDTLEQISAINVDDAEFIKDRIFPPVGVPRQYLYDDSFANANTNLSSKSIPFAKKIKRVQRYFIQQLYKLAIIELKLQQFSNAVIQDLTITMNNPSNLDEKDKIEQLSAVWNLIATIKQNNQDKVFYPDYLIYKNILRMNDDEIVELLKLAQLQQAGQNIFNFLPPEERPEGAEELENAPPPPPPGSEPMAGGAPMGGAPAPMPGEAAPADLAGEPGAAGAEAGGKPGGAMPAGVEKALGPAPETAEYIAPSAEQTYTEFNIDQFIEENIVQTERTTNITQVTVVEKRNQMLVEALQKKNNLLQTIKETTLILESMEQRKQNEKKEKLLEEGRKQKTSYSYFECVGEIDGIEEWMEKRNTLEEKKTYMEETRPTKTKAKSKVKSKKIKRK